MSPSNQLHRQYRTFGEIQRLFVAAFFKSPGCNCWSAQMPTWKTEIMWRGVPGGGGRVSTHTQSPPPPLWHDQVSSGLGARPKFTTKSNTRLPLLLTRQDSPSLSYTVPPHNTYNRLCTIQVPFLDHTHHLFAADVWPLPRTFSPEHLTLTDGRCLMQGELAICLLLLSHGPKLLEVAMESPVPLPPGETIV